jgi:ubiquinol-cytochrome c reductase iron-sulfur subunit
MVGRDTTEIHTWNSMSVSCPQVVSPISPSKFFLGEIIQVVWNGMPVFIRRLTQGEMDQEDKWPKSGILDTSTAMDPLKCGNSYLLVTSAICTHLGCVPIPYLGRFAGWACICHGSVFDKRGRVRQGPAAENLRTVNASVYGEIVCLEEKKFPREPSVRFWA